MSFKYILIPSDECQPMQELEGDKSGGLSNDFLLQSAKEYFFERNGGASRKAVLDNLSSEERKVYADQIRQQYGSNDGDKKLQNLDDDMLLNIFNTSQTRPSAEIIALTVPTELNRYQAVSMYGDDNARNRSSEPNSGFSLNARATALMQACGHTLPAANENEDGKPSGVYGDVFIGRCVDNEIGDVWERIDFTIDDVQGDPEDKEWCRIARRKGGGGGYNSRPAASLSGMMSNVLSGNSHTNSSLYVKNGDEDGYTWIQTDDEVELKFSLPPGTKAKYVKVKFSSKALKITAAGQTLCDGDLWSSIKVDECTYTVQDDELCLTLTKKVEENWSRCFSKKN